MGNKRKRIIKILIISAAATLYLCIRLWIAPPSYTKLAPELVGTWKFDEKATRNNQSNKSADPKELNTEIKRTLTASDVMVFRSDSTVVFSPDSPDWKQYYYYGVCKRQKDYIELIMSQYEPHKVFWFYRYESPSCSGLDFKIINYNQIAMPTTPPIFIIYKRAK